MTTFYKTLVAVLFANVFGFAAEAQPVIFNWATLQGGTSHDYGIAIGVDAQGNVYTTGEFKGNVDMDPSAAELLFAADPLTQSEGFISKFNSAGQIVWVKVFGGTNSFNPKALAVDGAGNTYSAGIFRGTVDLDPGAGVASFTTNGYGDVYILKLDPDGNFVWAKHIGSSSGDFAYDIDLDPGGNVILFATLHDSTDLDPGVGEAWFVNQGSYEDMYVLKLDAQGNYIWARRIGNDQSEGPAGICVDTQGNIVVTGYYRQTIDLNPGTAASDTSWYTSEGQEDLFIIKLDANGNYVWSRSIGNNSQQFGEDVDSDDNDNLYITGTYKGTLDFDPGPGVVEVSGDLTYRDVFVLKLTSDGDFVWVQTVGNNEHTGSGGIAVDNAGVAITGTFNGGIDINPNTGSGNTQYVSGPGNGDIFVLKLDHDGNFMWGGGVGGADQFDHPRKITAANGSTYVIGATNGTSIDGDPTDATFALTGFGNSDIFTLKVTDGVTSFGTPQGITGISVFPNPFNDRVSVRLSDALGDVHISILNVVGNQVFESFESSSNILHILLQKLPAGVYTLHITNANDRAVTKLVKH